MSENPTPTHDRERDTPIRDDGTAAAIVGLLLADDYQGAWTYDDIERELSSSPLAVTDALADLRAAGLIHIHDELVLPTNAARRMDALEL
jgi:hypothetical protein